MVTKRFRLITVLVLFMVPVAGASLADDADVLPKGVWRTRLDVLYYFPTNEEYDDSGNAVDVAKDYNVNLNSSVFPLPPGASLGRSVVSVEYKFTIFHLGLEYGLTDKLTLGALVPYWFVSTDVNTALDNSTTNLAISNTTGLPVPIGTPNSHPVTINDVQNLLVNIYGYKRVESWSGDHLGDIEVGGRYQYHKSTDWRLAFTGGVRFPTGKVDDPDNLVDYETGKGVYAALFRLNNDYKGIKNLVLNATVRYDLTFPDHIERRVPADPRRPLTGNKENVSRNYGDIAEVEFSGKYSLAKSLEVSGLYKYGYKGKDRISGTKGFPYSSLEAESIQNEQVYIIGVSYSTIPLFREKKFPVPMTFSLSYRDRFDGRNLLKTDYLKFGFALFF